MTDTPGLDDRLGGVTAGLDDLVGSENAAAFRAEQADLRSADQAPPAIAGDRLPESTVETTGGARVALSGLIAGAPAVLVFYRGAWCPYCNLTLQHYERTLAPELKSRGVTLIAISPQTVEGSRQAIENGDLGFTVVSDPGNALAASLGIATAPSDGTLDALDRLGTPVAAANADGTASVPFPTVLVLDENGVVGFADVHVDYSTRTETEEVLAAVDALRGTSGEAQD